jgi:glycosyltransferase involved in cell wall biosynthesis
MPGTRTRVAHVIDDLGHGGAQRQLLLAASELAGDIDASVVVLSDRVDPYAPLLRERGVDVVVLARRSHLEPARVAALARALRSRRVHLVHGVLDASNGYAFLAARLLGRPVVLSLRSDRLGVAGARAAVLRWMLRRADAVTVNSYSGRDHLLREVGVRADRVHLVPNIVPAPPVARAEAGGDVVGCVGRLTAVKRFEAVIEALARLRRSRPAARLVVVGDGPCRRRLEAAAARAGVSGQVEFTGAVDDAAPLIARFSCLVVASQHEGLTNVALEALSLGVPVVAVAAGDLPRVVAPGRTGVLAPDGSPPSLAGAIEQALSSPALRAAAAVEGPRLVREQFSAERARRSLAELYAALRGPDPKRIGRRHP